MLNTFSDRRSYMDKKVYLGKLYDPRFQRPRGCFNRSWIDRACRTCTSISCESHATSDSLAPISQSDCPCTCTPPPASLPTLVCRPSAWQPVLCSLISLRNLPTSSVIAVSRSFRVSGWPSRYYRSVLISPMIQLYSHVAERGSRWE